MQRAVLDHRDGVAGRRLCRCDVVAQGAFRLMRRRASTRALFFDVRPWSSGTRRFEPRIAPNRSDTGDLKDASDRGDEPMNERG